MPEEPKIELTQAQLKRLVRETVDETLTRIGVDIDNPLEMQADFHHIREWRQTYVAVRKKGLVTIIGILAAGTCATLWLGFKEFIHLP